MNLVKLALKYSEGKYVGNEKELREDLSSINIYEPTYSLDELEDTVYSIGDKNSWFEVRESLVNSKRISEDKYFEFKKLIDTIKGELK